MTRVLVRRMQLEKNSWPEALHSISSTSAPPSLCCSKKRPKDKKHDHRAKRVIDTSGFRTHAHFCSRGQTTLDVRLKSTALDHSAIVSRVRMNSFSGKLGLYFDCSWATRRSGPRLNLILCNNDCRLIWQVRTAYGLNRSSFRDSHVIGAPPIAISFHHRSGHYLDELWL
jgi:hypothetical protein